MADRIVLRSMEFQGHHGVGDEERTLPQQIVVDVDLTVDLRPAGESDDLAQTVDYGTVFEHCQAIVEARSFHLLEAIAEAIATDLLMGFTTIESVRVRVTKPGVPIDGVLESAGVEIERAR